MTPEHQNIARRLVGHPRWEWLEGMIGFDPEHPDMYQGRVEEACDAAARGGDVPVLTDWPTIGALLGVLVGSSPKDHEVDLGQSLESHEMWECNVVPSAGPPGPWGCGKTLGEAVARALLEVWGLP